LSIEKHNFKNLIHGLQLLDEIPSRDKIRIGTSVLIVQKQDQRTGNLTEGIVKRILTSSDFHPHGIKVELENGKIGRVQKIP